MRKVTCILDKTNFNKKPTQTEIVNIVNNLKKDVSKYQHEINLNELAHGLANGQTFKPALLNGSTGDTWIQQELFALDFDHNVTIQQQLNKCKELNIMPSFGYTSFSHTEKEHKFRLVFVSDKIINNIEKRHKLQITLMNIFSDSDEVTFDSARWFYGGKSLICEDYESTINYENIIEKYYNQEHFENKMKYFTTKKGKSKPSTKKHNIILDEDNVPQILYDMDSILYNIKGNKSQYNIQAIGNRDATYLKNVLNFPYKKCINNEDFFKYIFSIDINILLEYSNPDSFSCRFHDDHKPSASIFQTDEGIFFYKCHSPKCNVSYNLLNIIEKIGGFKSRPRAYRFIKEIFNIEIEDNEWQKEQKQILLDNMKTLNGELQERCPNTYKNIKSNIEYIYRMNLMAMDCVSSEKYTDDEGNILFYTSLGNICKEMNMKKSNTKRISQKAVLMQYHGLINKIDPETTSNSAVLEICNYSKAVNMKKENKYRKNISIFSIPSYTTDKLEEVEQNGIQWKNNGYTMTACSREMIYRTEGLEKANELYPQYKKITQNNKEIDRKTSKYSDRKTFDIINIIMKEIDNKGYVTEKQVIENLNKEYYKNSIKIQIKKSLKEICDSYGLTTVRLNKELKEKYNITRNGYPKIIIKD